ncbi:MAG TPA: DUF2845 domain-containing protein [Steroidobacteraceae bacterium]|nr:DUF2845 domain-containing protein [Steroidobacteraceae bacterium]
MNIRTATHFVMIAVWLSANPARADEPMRCGSALVTSQDSVATLVSKCGEPVKKESRVEDVLRKVDTGTVKVGTTTIEVWTYQLASGSLPRVVVIVDGKIKSIETRL